MDGVHELAVQLGGRVRGHRDDPDGAERHERQGRTVVAGVEVEVCVRQDGGGGLQVPLRVLERTDVGMLRERDDRLGLERHHGAARGVVEHDRQVHPVGHGLEVRADAGLVGLVVVRGDEQQPVHARLGRAARQLEGVRRVVGAGAGHDPGAVPHGLDDGAEHRHVLVVRERGGLAGGAGDHEAVGPAVHQVLGQRGGRLEVHGALVRHGGDHGGHDRAEEQLGGDDGGTDGTHGPHPTCETGGPRRPWPLRDARRPERSPPCVPPRPPPPSARTGPRVAGCPASTRPAGSPCSA